MEEKEISLKENTQKKRFTIFGVEFFYIGLLSIGLCFIGWIIENTVKLITHGVISSKCYLLPFISAYALIVFAIHIFLGDPDSIAIFGKRIFKKDTVKTRIASNILCYVFLCAFVFLAELTVGNVANSFFGIALWSYQGWLGNVTQFTSLPTTFGFGTAAYLGFRFVYKPALNFMRNKMSYKTVKTICIILGSLIIIDTVIMVIRLSIYDVVPEYWSLKIF